MELYDTKTEEAVLAAIILEQDAYLKVSDRITSLDFFHKKHSEIFEVIESLFLENKPIDMISIIKRLKENKSSISAYEVSEITNNIASSAHLEMHASILKDYSMRRKLINSIDKLKQAGEDTSTDLDRLLEQASTLVDDVVGELDQKNTIRPFKDNVSLALENIEEKQKEEKSNPKYGVYPSNRSVRELVPLWENQSLIIIAARPSMGKTAYVVQEAVEIAKNHGPVLFFSLEMSVIKLTNRILQRESGLSRYDFDGYMDPEKWNALEDAVTHVENLGLFIDDTSSVGIGHIKTKAKLFKKKYGIKALVVDYLQLMNADSRLQREQQVATISRSMKGIAKELDIPVFLLAQLSRKSENRKEEGFKPKLADLRESGAIEQDADVVIFPFRPAYYFPDEPEHQGVCLFIVAKNRDGSIGEAFTNVNETVTKFSDNIYFEPNSPF